VGVSGHRPNRLERSEPALLAEKIAQVLGVIRLAGERGAKTSMGSPAATLRVLSSLAEGADRLVASAALDQGYVLQVPLPFPQLDYLADFETESSKEEFRALLKRADAVYELAAPDGDRAYGYRAAGQIIVDQCDILIVLWDGEPGRGIGGTTEMMERANSLGVPVVRIDAVAPHPISFRKEAEPLDALAACIESLVVPQSSACPALDTYRQEPWPARLAITSYLFTRVFGESRWRLPRSPILDDLHSDLESPILERYFRWTDALADRYGERSRSAALQIQLLATASVVCGLLSIPFDDHPTVLRVLSSLELTTTLLVILNAFILARRPWHARWLLYRSLAEHLRSLDLLAPLARSMSIHSATDPAVDPDSGAAFASWYLGSVIRHLPLARAVVTPGFLEERRRQLGAAVASQESFQAATAERYEAVEQTLHRFGFVLFLAAVGLSFYDVAHAFGLILFTSAWILTCSALLPALGAAFASLATQGEYKRLAGRAHRLNHTLALQRETLKYCEPITLGSLADIASGTADALTSEVQDWQALVSTRKPSLPV
jgi:hypothetical protein